MSYFGKNIRKIRNVKKWTQSHFADLFALSRASIGAYEEERAEPRIDTVMQIARYFNLSLDELLTKELTVNALYKFDIFKPKLQQRSGENLQLTCIPFVSSELLAAFLKQHKNPAFINNLPQLVLPVQKSTTYLAFQINKTLKQVLLKVTEIDDILVFKACKNNEMNGQHYYLYFDQQTIIFNQKKNMPDIPTKALWELMLIVSQQQSLETIKIQLNRLEQKVDRLLPHKKTPPLSS